MLSVVIITCNRVETVTKSIVSCKEHCSMEWELIVVDNGSTDGTREAIEKVCREENIDYRYHYSDVNLGVAGARNLGYDMAKGDIVYFIDDDAFIISEGNCLDIAYRYLKKKKKVLVLATKIWDESINGLMTEFTENGAELVNGVRVRCFVGCSHMIKKDEKIAPPLYPNNLFYGAEEIYLSYRVYKSGCSVEYYEGVFVEHHPSNNTRGSRYDILKNRTVNWHIVKQYCYPQPFLFVSWLFYIYRTLKLTKCSALKLKEMHHLRVTRYDSQYRCKLTAKEMKRLIKRFGWRYLV